jgi:VWFA-related protein
MKPLKPALYFRVGDDWLFRNHARSAGSFLLVAFVFLLWTSVSPGHTQTPSLPQQNLFDVNDEVAPTLKIKVNEVDLLFTARDRHNHWVTDLSEEDVTVLDNGQPPSSILEFKSRSDLPLRVGLIVDSSDSISRQIKFEKQSSIAFIRQVLNPAKDSAFVVSFNENVSLVQGFTSDLTALSTAIRELPLGGSTALYDAVHFGCEKLQERADGQPARRVLIVITDGDDNSSHYSAREAIAAALQQNVVIIALNTNSEPSSLDPKFKQIKEMAEVSGGLVLQASSEKDVAKAFKAIQEQLRSHYFMAYKPAELSQDGSFRKIKVKVKRHGLHVFYRHGYYAPVAMNEPEKQTIIPE